MIAPTELPTIVFCLPCDYKSAVGRVCNEVTNALQKRFMLRALVRAGWTAIENEVEQAEHGADDAWYAFIKLSGKFCGSYNSLIVTSCFSYSVTRFPILGKKPELKKLTDNDSACEKGEQLMTFCKRK